MHRTTILLLALLLGHPSLAQVPSAAATKGEYAADFDSAWVFVRDTYAYFDEKKVDWDRVKRDLAPRAAAARNRDEFVGVLEQLIESIYDSHAHLHTNTATSPRLIPSNADLWAQYRDGRGVITSVRVGSEAERAGLREGMEIVSINGRPVREAVEARRPRALRAPDPTADDWALRAELAGFRNGAVRVEARASGKVQAFEFTPGNVARPDTVLSAKSLANGIAYIRINNSLGDDALVAAWDAALAAHRDSRALILDLRDVPGGGNSSVARGMLGRLISKESPYQRHELTEGDRVTGIKRIWVEYVAPRGPFTYDKPVVALVGRWTSSMGEGIAIALDGMNRAIVIGTPMAGLLGAVYSDKLPRTGIGIQVPAERLFHVNGTPRESFVPRAPEKTSAPDDDEALVGAIASANEEVNRSTL